MNPRKLRFALAVILFVGWIGWLTYLAFANRNPVILSRPQLLASNVHVIAKLTGAEKPNKQVIVQEVLWSADQGALKKGDAIKVGNLDQVDSAQGWNGSGSYLLPLTRLKDGEYRLTITPSSPGYPPAKFSTADRLEIYPATDETRERLEQVYAEWGR